MTEEENSILEEANIKKSHPMGKARFGIYYLVFCAAIFMFWQLLGGAMLAYNKLGYTLGYASAYVGWSVGMMVIWIIGSIAFAIVAYRVDE